MKIKNIYVHAFAPNQKFESNNYLYFKASNSHESYYFKIYIEKDNGIEIYNYPIPAKYQNVQCLSPQLRSGTVYLTKNKVYTLEQQEHDKRWNVQSDNGLYFSEVHNNKSNKLIITFSGFINLNSKIKYPLTYLQDFRDVNKLIFQDRYLINGTYFKYDDTGASLKMKIINKIKLFIVEHHILESNILFFGSSKGGSAAVEYGSYFPQAKIISVVPQLNIDYTFNDSYIFGNFHKNSLGTFF